MTQRMARAFGLVLMFLVAPFVGVMGLLFLFFGRVFGGFLLIPLAWVLGITGLVVSRGWRPRKTTFAILGVAGAIIGGIVGSALILPPNIVLTGGGDLVIMGYDDGSCEYAFSFGLANFGGAGFVKVQFLVEGRVMGDTDFFVPAFSSVWVNPSLLVDGEGERRDCATPLSSIPAVQIASAWK